MAHKILIVDDEADLVETCVRVLSRRGFTCLRAYAGRAGLALIDEEQPSIVLTDLSLPDIDGFTILRHARAQSPSIPGILMTAYNSPGTIERASDAGARACLAKPFSNSALLEAIQAVLR